MSAHTARRARTPRATMHFVKRARATLGLSPEAFGERLGVTRQTVWRYEKGDPVKRSVMMAIASLLAEQEHEHDNKRVAQ